MFSNAIQQLQGKSFSLHLMLPLTRSSPASDTQKFMTKTSGRNTPSSAPLATAVVCAQTQTLSLTLWLQLKRPVNSHCRGFGDSRSLLPDIPLCVWLVAGKFICDLELNIKAPWVSLTCGRELPPLLSFRGGKRVLAFCYFAGLILFGELCRFLSLCISVCLSICLSVSFSFSFSISLLPLPPSPPPSPFLLCPSLPSSLSFFLCHTFIYFHLFPTWCAN